MTHPFGAFGLHGAPLEKEFIFPSAHACSVTGLHLAPLGEDVGELIRMGLKDFDIRLSSLMLISGLISVRTP